MVDDIDWEKKYQEQITINDSLKKDYAELYKKLPPEPCPGAYGEVLGCRNRLQCWEPCGNLGNDERFVSVSPRQDIPLLVDKIG